MRVEIDNRSGFCFGVVKAIQAAERNIGGGRELYCLGDIVHNEQEVARLGRLGLKAVSHGQLNDLKGKHVLIRAHGEPPSTYRDAEKNGIVVIDATCPVVLRLQQRIHRDWQAMRAAGGTVVIYGKKGHAEVIGLVGHTCGEAVVVESTADLDGLNFAAPVSVFSQTTKEPGVFAQIVAEIKRRMAPHFADAEMPLSVNNTICGQVANRQRELAAFAVRHDVVIFVSGLKSSNGKMLFDTCKQANANSYLVSSPEELDPGWIAGAESVGVGGATSTPQWLMESVARRIAELAADGCS